jgi:hypothetical protein
MNHTQESIEKVLKEIQSRVPKEFLKGVVTERPLTPVMEKVVDDALASPDFPEAKKLRLQHLKDAGEFNKKTYYQSPKYAKMIDNFVNREINKAVKAGRLPNKKQLKTLQEEWKTQKNIGKENLK